AQGVEVQGLHEALGRGQAGEGGVAVGGVGAVERVDRAGAVHVRGLGAGEVDRLVGPGDRAGDIADEAALLDVEHRAGGFDVDVVDAVAAVVLDVARNERLPLGQLDLELVLAAQAAEGERGDAGERDGRAAVEDIGNITYMAAGRAPDLKRVVAGRA